MAHFAKLNTFNIVESVECVNNETLNNLPFPESEPIGIAFLNDLYKEDFIWRQTSFSASFRKNMAGIGFTYDATLDAFIPPKPYPSWILNTQTCLWEAPIPYPDDGKYYRWNEESQFWDIVENNNG